MKVSVVMLALVVVTGSWAFVTREATSPNSKVDVLLQEWKGHLWNATRAAQKKWGHIERSKTAEAVVNPVVYFFSRWKEELPPEVTEAAKVVFGVPWSIGAKAVSVLHELLIRLRPPPEEFLAALKSALAFYLDPVLERVNLHLDLPRQTLIARMQELDRAAEEKLAQHLESLDNSLPHYFEKLGGVHTSLEPFTDWAEKQLREGLEVLNKNLKAYLAPFLEETQKYREEFEEWAKTPVFPRKQP